MLFTTLYVLISLPTLSLCSVLPRNAYDLSRGIVRVPITAVVTNSTISKRQIHSGPIINNQNGLQYFVTIGIGTLLQNMTVAFDTGSSNLWVNADCRTALTPLLCQSNVQYQAKLSTTAKNLKIENALQYGQGFMKGVLYSDNVAFEGAQIVAQEFTVASETSQMDVGLIGVGLGSSFFGNATPPNVIDEMAAQSIISSRAFSMDLGSVDTAEGSIIFGGIDTKKYSGELAKFPMIPKVQAPDNYPRYWMSMTSVGATKPGSTVSTTFFTGNQPVFLDSGTTLCYLPAAIMAPVIKATGATHHQPGSSQYVVPCSMMNQPGSIEFGFGNLTISIPYKQFLWQAGTDGFGDVVCVLGVMESDPVQKAFVLGDTFLRSAFVVYGQDNQNIHLAQAANCGTNLVPIGKGVNAVPSVAGDCAAATPIAAPIASTVVVSAKPVVTVAPKPTLSLRKRRRGWFQGELPRRRVRSRALPELLMVMNENCGGGKGKVFRLLGTYL